MTTTRRSLRRVRPGADVAAVLAAVSGAVVALLVRASVALAESPTPAAAGGDPRSAGQGPGLVGDPLAAIGVVALIALVSIALTVAYVRSTGVPRGGPPAR